MALADLLRHSSDCRRLFLQFLFGEIPPMVLASAERLEVRPQYSFAGALGNVESIGRIDLALLLPQKTSMIGVEFKVRDRERPGKLRHYRMMMNHEFPGPNWLFEIVQRREHEIEATVIDRVHSWNDLHNFLSQNLQQIRDSATRASTTEYLEFLQASRTVLPINAAQVREAPRFTGVPDSSVCRDTFLKIAGSLPADVTASIESDKNIPRQLRLGRAAWAKKFGCVWVQRIWLNLRIEPDTGHHFVWAHLIFHNAIFTKFEYASRMLPKWAAICSEAGFTIRRGPAHGWDGKKGADLHPPWVLDCRPKYFFAEEPLEELSRAATQSDGSRQWIIKDIQNRLPGLLALVDSFPT